MRKLLALTTAIVLQLTAACTVHQDQAPTSLSGPAEAALSLRMSATPDSLVQDGNQSARIAISAFDASGNPIAANVRLAISPFNFGTLSASTVTTRADAANPVVVVYIPPATVSGGANTVTIQAALIGSNAVTASTQQVSLFVNPAAAIASTAPTASFLTSPSAPITNVNTTFDASTSCGGQLVSGACTSTSALTNFAWDFGDKTPSLTGKIVGHTFTANGNFSVTLTVTNDQGKQASTTQIVMVNTVAAPSASFVVSPTTIHVGDTVNFNAAASKAALGHTIQQYVWNFGNGSSQTTTANSLSVPNAYAAANTYKVTLTVVDDLGQTGTTEVDVVVVP